MPISMMNTFFSSLMKQFYIFAFLIFLASNLMAESYVRIRGLQASPLLSSSSEKGKFKSGNSEIPLKTPPSLSQSTMISYGILGIGSSSITTTFTFSGKEYIWLCYSKMLRDVFRRNEWAISQQRIMKEIAAIILSIFNFFEGSEIVHTVLQIFWGNTVESSHPSFQSRMCGVDILQV